jgi:hypothetical protein
MAVNVAVPEMPTCVIPLAAPGIPLAADAGGTPLRPDLAVEPTFTELAKAFSEGADQRKTSIDRYTFRMPFPPFGGMTFPADCRIIPAGNRRTDRPRGQEGHACFP